MFSGDLLEKKFDIKSVVSNDLTYKDKHFIQQIFNQYFTSNGEKIKETMPDQLAVKSFSDYINNIYMPNSFYFSPVSSEQNQNIISSL